MSDASPKATAESIVLYERIERIVQQRLTDLQAAHGRKLRDVTSNNKYIQFARGKQEAYREILGDLKELKINA